MFKPFTTETIAKQVTGIAMLLVLFAGPAAMAQTSGKAAPSSGARQLQTPRDAPIGHRQPRADQVPSEKDLANPDDPINKENAELDRKLKSICRGC